MSNLELSKITIERLKKYPILSFVVNNFIENNGINPCPHRVTPLTVYIKWLEVFEPDLFDWDSETTEDFCSWGHNSRYANVLEPMMHADLNSHISYLLEYLENSGRSEPQTIEYYKDVLDPSKHE